MLEGKSVKDKLTLKLKSVTDTGPPGEPFKISEFAGKLVNVMFHEDSASTE